MKRFLAIMLAVCSCSFSTATIAAQADLILYKRDPWLMVIGSDSPVFAHYTNGLTIFLAGQTYKSVELDEKENKKLMNRFSRFGKIRAEYSLSDWSDQPTNELYFSTNGKMNKIWIYGDLKKESDNKGTLPKELLNSLQYLDTYSHKDATDWVPKYLEVMIWPYEYAPDKSIVWPDSFPDLKSPWAIHRGKSGYSIYLPYSKQAQFYKFINTRKPRGAVLINGKKWSVASRTPFPHEIPPGVGVEVKP